MRTLIAHLFSIAPLLLCFVAWLSSLWLFACSGAPSAPPLPGAPQVQFTPGLAGVPDRGSDPAVVLVEAPGAMCAGALIDADVVLTARRCLEIGAAPASCADLHVLLQGRRDLTTVRVLVGDDPSTATERARGLGMLAVSGDDPCRDDIALLMLDQPIDDVTPFTVSATGAATSDHVRSVAFGDAGKVVRDHVPVIAVSSGELALGEVPCAGSAGGAVIDETTGQLVGVLSHGEPRCGDEQGWDVAARPDAYFDLVQRALAAGHVSHETDKAKEKKGAIDLGATCEDADQCAAGACVSFAGAQYCTRRCNPTDRCPSRYRCTQSVQSTTICVAE